MRVLIHHEVINRQIIRVLLGPAGDGELASPADKTPKLPNLQPHDRTAYQMSLIEGMNQEEIAKVLTKRTGKPFSQGQVSRMIDRVKAHAEASGLAALIPTPAKSETAMDPQRIDIGKRTDGRTPRQRAPRDPDAD